MESRPGQRRGDVEIRNYLQAGSRGLFFDLSVTQRFGALAQVATRNKVGCSRIRRTSTSFSTGPPGDSGALQCHWNTIAKNQFGHVPFLPRGLVSEFEEQSRTRGGQSGGVEDQPQY
jgi:hypothetical protein